MKNGDKLIRIAILDLYDGVVNQGIDALFQLIDTIKSEKSHPIEVTRFDVRKKHEIPGMDFDIYISSGGPGSPIDTSQSWEKDYFHWLYSVTKHNEDSAGQAKKFVFFICHSFQLACRHFNLAHVSKRSKNAFGIYPVELTTSGKTDNNFSGLSNPFWVVDSRDYQATLPDIAQFEKSGASILATELGKTEEKALMAIRFNPFMIGTQFHPEANDVGLNKYMNNDVSKSKILAEHGIEVWNETIHKLKDPEGIRKTYSTIIPRFILQAIDHLEINKA
jgi:GMP synthase-like glutamine amidotransferase